MRMGGDGQALILRLSDRVTLSRNSASRCVIARNTVTKQSRYKRNTCATRSPRRRAPRDDSLSRESRLGAADPQSLRGRSAGVPRVQRPRNDILRSAALKKRERQQWVVCHRSRPVLALSRPPRSTGLLQSVIVAALKISQELAFLRRPAIGFGAGAAHQHRPFTVAQAVGQAEGLEGLFIVDDREGVGPRPRLRRGGRDDHGAGFLASPSSAMTALMAA